MTTFGADLGLSNNVAFAARGARPDAPGVPIPAFDTGDHSPSGAYDLADFPASQPNASIQPADPFGIVVLMNADWAPTGTPGPGPGPGGPPITSGPPLTFETPMALVRRNQAIIDPTCTLAAPCLGDLRLQNQPAPGAVITHASSPTGAGASTCPPGRPGW
ncbi:MAG: hypothetical protein E6J79_15895 [Deltaproteobacteria bacterium]|nr:MAG: hypothetical protein E6J79_15895 [Deltaproteobacteria bacterium]